MSTRVLLPVEVEHELTELELMLDETGCRRLNRIRGFLLSAHRELDDLRLQERSDDLAVVEHELRRGGRA